MQCSRFMCANSFVFRLSSSWPSLAALANLYLRHPFSWPEHSVRPAIR
jgi:hypothetical protein